MKIKCPVCKGSGQVQLPPAYPRFHPAYGDCRKCQGTGLTNKTQLKKETQLIKNWLHNLAGEFDDWNWNGKDLTLFWKGKVIGEYPWETVAESVPGFPA